jgi:hypothetical protein
VIVGADWCVWIHPTAEQDPTGERGAGEPLIATAHEVSAPIARRITVLLDVRHELVRAHSGTAALHRDDLGDGISAQSYALQIKTVRNRTRVLQSSFRECKSVRKVLIL